MIAGNPLAGPCPYDVGDILHTANAASPSDRWPGTEWAAITTFLLGASAAHPAGTTGGEETHTLTVEEMPQHEHPTGDGDGYWRYGGEIGNLQSGSGIWARRGSKVEPQGGSQPHNNMPPYTSVYIWQRTA